MYAIKGKFVLFNDTSSAHWFSYYWLLDVKHMFIVTYLCRGNQHMFLISSKGSFMCTFPQTGQHMLQPLIDQLWTSGWNRKYPKLQILAPCRIDPPCRSFQTLTAESSIAWATSRPLHVCNHWWLHRLYYYCRYLWCTHYFDPYLHTHIYIYIYIYIFIFI